MGCHSEFNKLLVWLFVQVDKVRGNYSGKLFSLQDICLKPLGTPCATQSVLQVSYYIFFVVYKPTSLLNKVPGMGQCFNFFSLFHSISKWTVIYSMSTRVLVMQNFVSRY